MSNKIVRIKGIIETDVKGEDWLDYFLEFIEGRGECASISVEDSTQDKVAEEFDKPIRREGNKIVIDKKWLEEQVAKWESAKADSRLEREAAWMCGRIQVYKKLLGKEGEE